MKTVDELMSAVLAGERGPDPAGSTATSVFWVHHGTRLAGGDVTYLNQYVLVRLGGSFGACAFEPGELDSAVCRDASGSPLDTLLREAPRPLRIAALDAFLAEGRPHREAPDAEAVTLPAGSPEERAAARDAAVAGLLDLPGSPGPTGLSGPADTSGPAGGPRVAVIGVVNPLMAAVRARGGTPLPCDFTLRTTAWGDPVSRDMHEVLDRADAVVATGMTIGNGTFDTLIGHCRDRALPLVVYAQTGSAIAREFLGSGVTALSAEPFPFSQFSGGPTALYRYRDRDRAASRS
ncbi:Rossmann-like domain-containing protein [Streptomyces clavuligerus]|uniref:DUF364 domain-containing protein n=1 Tax=Streptomyces clavuligerus TaxID=1901 RepID=B5GWB1_STRCL|nr:DUF364 domain-containing protein [Streptomyces clavuligerus]ANW17669.1 hypothetical protein BB341_05220 [Streptomyces clavuligerus]AXU12218.1 hypothetical protein D1794_05415 [Streptomyces clavuligerus]EDY50607.1 conserved hypothetical protein [Streptomyces clavuligerus]EFG09809.1 DUF364 domain-containing protein [Streptomyces clavuligerus]MBY6302088.1 hypothetical protein [Streptomyces clavuligerus]